VLDSAGGYAALIVAVDDKEVLTVELKKVNLLALSLAWGPFESSETELTNLPGLGLFKLSGAQGYA
jgi:hypothetical protein